MTVGETLGGIRMDQIKTGALIRTLRAEQGFTQRTLAEKLCVSDKAVSKWERGCGTPDGARTSYLVSGGRYAAAQETA